jgi:hypothetical protein
MAGEITMAAQISCLATNFNEVINPGQISIDLPSGPVLTGDSGLQTLSTASTGADLNVGNLSNSQDGGIYYFRNTGTVASQNIEVGEVIGGVFYAWLLLLPGEFSVGRLSSRYPGANALRVRSTAGTPAIQYRIFAGAL